MSGPDGTGVDDTWCSGCERWCRDLGHRLAWCECPQLQCDGCHTLVSARTHAAGRCDRCEVGTFRPAGNAEATLMAQHKPPAAITAVDDDARMRAWLHRWVDGIDAIRVRHLFHAFSREPAPMTRHELPGIQPRKGQR